MTASNTIHLMGHLDPSSGKDILLWVDITTAFYDVLQVRSGTLIQSFLKGADLKTLDPPPHCCIPWCHLASRHQRQGGTVTGVIANSVSL
ncbi:hypothetical protein BGZ88_009942 [Linnemannia elongata]|nr:hypothetical protein BGZ88_009942 [Linnemannia elongata]